MKRLSTLVWALTCLLLIWPSEADGVRRPIGARLRRRPGTGRPVTGRLRDGRSSRARPGLASAVSVHSSGASNGWQADEGVGLQNTRMGARPGTPRGRARARVTRMPSSPGSPNLLATFAGKNRVLVISAPHDSDGYYRLMMSLLKDDVYCELAERHVQQIVMFHQEGEMGGKVRRITAEGKVMEEPLDTALVPRLMSFLKLEKGKFGMVLLKKTLQVEERYPYPVRLEAMYEVIDQSPMRRLEKIRQKGFVQKCKGAGVEGQVEEGALTVGPPAEGKPPKKILRKPTTTTTTATTTTTVTTTKPTTAPTTTTRATTTTTTTTRPTTVTTTTKATSTMRRNAAKRTTTTLTPSRGHAQTALLPAPGTTQDPYYHRRSEKQQHPAKTTPAGDNQTHEDDSQHPDVHKAVDVTRKPSKMKPGRKKNRGEKTLTNEYEVEPTVASPEESDASVDAGPARKVKTKHDKKKKNEKKAERRGGKTGKKNGKKASKYPEKEDYPKPTKKTPPKGSLTSFLDYFENRRRLLLVTSPSEDDKMYVQQRDEYLESVCEMAIRKVSIVTVFGSLANSTMKIDHYQLENDKPMKGLRQEDLVNQDLITQLRKEFRMIHDDFHMVLTDTDMRVKQSYEVPIAMKSVFNYMDTFSSRIREMEQQKRDGVHCKKEDKPRSLENFLSRFRWRRRLFIISTPNDEEWAYQQQLYGLGSQACNLGLRHISILKLVGTELSDMGGVLELYPFNGSATVEREGLSTNLVKDIRNYFQISPEYFSMLLVGKDGNVKSWYPSPMWSMAIIYDLVDSMQLRRQEMAIQQSLGMRCPEDEYGGYGYHQHGYQDGYHQGYGY
ncbi:coiled-coil domain-containing protein 80 isoform X1 [Stigmatopora argus]